MIYKLLDWININKLNFYCLFENKNVLELLEEDKNDNYWNYLSLNSSEINYMENNIDKINWYYLSKNKNSINILDNRYSIYKEELIQKALHPSKLQRYFDEGYDFDEVMNFL